MKTIYCISGLGADERVFSKLHINGYQTCFLPWLIPQKKETIREYAERMCEGIKETNPVLLGLSFGGILCIEISKIIPVDKVIIISSIKTARELPRWMKIAGRLKLNRLLPLRSFRILESIQNSRLGVLTAEEKELVREYRRKYSQQYINWSVNEILNWKNDQHPSRLYHIHGDTDKVFPVKNIQPTYLIKGGGHFMIMNRVEELNRLLADILE